MDSNMKIRDSNIELLRIICIIGVILLHYNNPEIGGGISYSNSFINNEVLYWLESVVICSVDLFMIISGYFMVKSEQRNSWKILELLTQVILFRVLVYLLEVICGEAFSIKHLFINFLPINYFVTLYSVSFFLSIYVGYAMNRLNQQTVKKLLILLVMFFSVLPSLLDFIECMTDYSLSGINPVGVNGDGNGYTFVNFLLCWIIGAYIRITNFYFSKKKCFLIFFGLTLVIYAYAKFMFNVSADLDKSFSYCNPLILFEAFVIFIFFKQLNLGQNNIINTLAKGSFTAYLVHSYFLKFIGIKFFVKQNFVIMILHIIVSIVAIYLICWCIYFIYDLITKEIWKRLRKKIDLPKLYISERN